MDSFLTQLTAAIQRTVMTELGAKLNQFTDNIVAESKGALTKEQVMAQWAKVSPDLVVKPENKPSPSAPRTKTDKNRKCQVLKKSGANVGQPCGANCVVGKDTCTRHSPKEEKSPAVVPAAAPVAPAASGSVSLPVPMGEHKIPSDEGLKAMTVVKLKELAKEMKVNVPSKARKDEVISELVKARISTVPSAAPVVPPQVCEQENHEETHEDGDEEIEE